MFKEHPMDILNKFKETVDCDEYSIEERELLCSIIKVSLDKGLLIDSTEKDNPYYLLSLWYYRDNENAKELYIKSIDAGNTNAMNNLGCLYEYIEKDFKSAKEWYVKSVDLGNTHAMNNLGNLFLREKDYEHAKEWYHKAADLGNSHAMNGLGSLYYFEKDYQNAKEWYHKAADLGNSGAIINLGYFYEHRKDYQSLKEWYIKRVDLGDTQAKEDLKRLKRKCPELFQKKLEKIYDSDSCSICYENYIGSSSYKITLNCGHTYHYSCVQKETKCPYCREPLNFR
jgi:hypothetical protein